MSDIYHGGYNSDELKEIFGYFLYQNIWEDNTYQEAAAKVAEWEKTKAKEEIKIGDVVKSKYYDAIEFCVTDIDCNGHIYGIGRYGAIYNDKDPEDWKKIGRNVDVDSFLKQIRGKENEGNL